jgi:hypothetical protein
MLSQVTIRCPGGAMIDFAQLAVAFEVLRVHLVAA